VKVFNLKDLTTRMQVQIFAPRQQLLRFPFVTSLGLSNSGAA
jgi:hypothetical protein